MILDAVTNFAFAKLLRGYGQAANVVELEAGGGAKFPDPATEGEYNLVWWNQTDYNEPAKDPEVEIVRVTGKTGDILTILRAQEGTPATIKDRSGKDYRLTLTLTAKVIDDIRGKFQLQENSAPVKIFDTNPTKLEAASDIKKEDLVKLIDVEYAKVEPIKSDFSQIISDEEYLVEAKVTQSKSINYSENKSLVVYYDSGKLYAYPVEMVNNKLTKGESFVLSKSSFSGFDLELTDDEKILVFYTKLSTSTVQALVLDPVKNFELLSNSSFNLGNNTNHNIFCSKGFDGGYAVLQTNSSSSALSFWRYSNSNIEFISSQVMSCRHSIIGFQHFKENKFLLAYGDTNYYLNVQLYQCTNGGISTVRIENFKGNSNISYQSYPTFIERINDDNYLLIHNTYNYILNINNNEFLLSPANLNLNFAPAFAKKISDELVIISDLNKKTNLIKLSNGELVGNEAKSFDSHSICYATFINSTDILIHLYNNSQSRGFLSITQTIDRLLESNILFPSFIDDTTESGQSSFDLQATSGNYGYRYANIDVNRSVIIYFKNNSIYGRIVEKTQNGVIEHEELKLSYSATPYSGSSFKNDKEVFLLSENRFVAYYSTTNNYLYEIVCTVNADNTITRNSESLRLTYVNYGYGFRAKIVDVDTIAIAYSYSINNQTTYFNLIKYVPGQNPQTFSSGYVNDSISAEYQNSTAICKLTNKKFVVTSVYNNNTYASVYQINESSVTKLKCNQIFSSHCSRIIELEDAGNDYFFLVHNQYVKLFYFDGTTTSEKESKQITHLNGYLYSIFNDNGEAVLSYSNSTSSSILKFKRNVDKIEMIEDYQYDKGYSNSYFCNQSLKWGNELCQFYVDSSNNVKFYFIDFNIPSKYIDFSNNDIMALRSLKLSTNNLIYLLGNSTTKEAKLILYSVVEGKRKLLKVKKFEYDTTYDRYAFCKVSDSRFLLANVDKSDTKSIILSLYDISSGEFIQVHQKQVVTSDSNSCSWLRLTDLAENKAFLLGVSVNKYGVAIKIQGDVINTGTVTAITNTNAVAISKLNSNQVIIGYQYTSASISYYRNSVITVNEDLSFSEAESIDLQITGNSSGVLESFYINDDYIILYHQSNNYYLTLIKKDEDGSIVKKSSQSTVNLSYRDVIPNPDGIIFLTGTQSNHSYENPVFQIRRYEVDYGQDTLTYKNDNLFFNDNTKNKKVDFWNDYIIYGTSNSSNIFRTGAFKFISANSKKSFNGIDRITGNKSGDFFLPLEENKTLRLTSNQNPTKLEYFDFVTNEIISSVELYNGSSTAVDIKQITLKNFVAAYSYSSRIYLQYITIKDNELVVGQVTASNNTVNSYSCIGKLSPETIILTYKDSSNYFRFEKYFIEGDKITYNTYSQDSDSTNNPSGSLSLSEDESHFIGSNSSKINIYKYENYNYYQYAGTLPTYGGLKSTSIDTRKSEFIVAAGVSSNTIIYRHLITSNHNGQADIDARKITLPYNSEKVKIVYLNDSLALCYMFDKFKLNIALIELGANLTVKSLYEMTRDFNEMHNVKYEVENSVLKFIYSDLYVGQPRTAELTFPDIWNYFGYAQEDAAAGQELNVAYRGKISSIHKGLKPATKYHIDFVTLKPTSIVNHFEIGMSMDANRILMKMPEGLDQFIKDNTIDY